MNRIDPAQKRLWFIGGTNKEIDFRSSQRRTIIELVPWGHTTPEVGEVSRKRRYLNRYKTDEEEVARERGGVGRSTSGRGNKICGSLEVRE